jgi:hypothetical protein
MATTNRNYGPCVEPSATAPWSVNDRRTHVGAASFSTLTVTKADAQRVRSVFMNGDKSLEDNDSQGWIRTTIGGSKDRPPAGRFKMPTLADSSTLSGSGCFWAFDCYKIRDRAHA